MCPIKTEAVGVNMSSFVGMKLSTSWYNVDLLEDSASVSQDFTLGALIG